MLDVVLPAVSGPLGLVCCQGVGVVLVDTVVPMSPAYRADLRRDDVVLAIDNKPVNNVAQVCCLQFGLHEKRRWLKVVQCSILYNRSGVGSEDA